MISQAGVGLIKHFEGFRANVYSDATGHATIGYGHKLLPGERFSGPISEAQGTSILMADAAIAESAVRRCVAVPLSQAQLDALISLVFNWGAANFCASSMLKMLNAGRYLDAAARLRVWPITSKGVRLEGLVRRRAAEADLFLSGMDLEENPGETEGGGGFLDGGGGFLDGGGGFLDDWLDTDSDIDDFGGPSTTMLALIVGVGVLAYSLLNK